MAIVITLKEDGDFLIDNNKRKLMKKDSMLYYIANNNIDRLTIISDQNAPSNTELDIVLNDSTIMLILDNIMVNSVKSENENLHIVYWMSIIKDNVMFDYVLSAIDKFSNYEQSINFDNFIDLDDSHKVFFSALHINNLVTKYIKLFLKFIEVNPLAYISNTGYSGYNYVNNIEDGFINIPTFRKSRNLFYYILCKKISNDMFNYVDN